MWIEFALHVRLALACQQYKSASVCEMKGSYLTAATAWPSPGIISWGHKSSMQPNCPAPVVCNLAEGSCCSSRPATFRQCIQCWFWVLTCDAWCSTLWKDSCSLSSPEASLIWLNTLTRTPSICIAELHIAALQDWTQQCLICVNDTRLLAVACSLVSFVDGEAHKAVVMFKSNDQVSTHNFMHSVNTENRLLASLCTLSPQAESQVHRLGAKKNLRCP